MITFLFWNIQRKPLQKVIASVAVVHQVDVIILAECAFAPSTLLEALRAESSADYRHVPGIVSAGYRGGNERGRLEVFAKFSFENLRPVYETKRLTIRRLESPSGTDFLLCAAHSPSKLHWSDSSQDAEIALLADDIRRAEALLGHRRSILVGDLNMNPFQAGVVNASSLHGVMTKQIARRRERIVSGRAYPFFYNPMWRFFGDRASGPPGTHYRQSSTHTEYFWHIPDQVLVRPELIDKFVEDRLHILSSVGDTNFLTRNGTPTRRNFSDHLPILFAIDL